MKNHLYLLIISFSLISCYTYKAKAENNEKTPSRQQFQTASDQMMAEKISIDSQSKISAVEKGRPKANRNQVASQPMTVQQKLEPNKYFKVEVGGQPYKIQVDKWDSDTLVAHVVNKPKKVLKFHKNQINQSTIAERRFSQPTADIITVVAYAAAGVGIWALVK